MLTDIFSLVVVCIQLLYPERVQNGIDAIAKVGEKSCMQNRYIPETSPFTCLRFGNGRTEWPDENSVFRLRKRNPGNIRMHYHIYSVLLTSYHTCSTF